MDTDFAARDIVLRDGRTVRLRAMRPSDEAEILQAFERMSADARYMRFMRFVREPNLERVRAALASFPAHGFGIVATVPAADGVDIVGSAAYLTGPDALTCEFAITVGEAFGGAGLGGALLGALIGVARQRGLARMEGFVLAQNRSMLKLATRLRFGVERDPDDHGVRVCKLHL